MQGSALEAAGVVGTWTTDVAAGRSVLEGRAATIMAGDPALAGHALPMEVALARIHPGDRAWVFACIRRVRMTGGPFAAEFRVLDAAGGVRWILNRGLLIRDAAGAMLGSSAYIDTTDCHRALMFPTRVPADADAVDALEEAAEHGLRAHDAVGRLGNRPLRLLTDLFLLEIGRALAGRRRP